MTRSDGTPGTDTELADFVVDRASRSILTNLLAESQSSGDGGLDWHRAFIAIRDGLRLSFPEVEVLAAIAAHRSDEGHGPALYRVFDTSAGPRSDTAHPAESAIVRCSMLDETIARGEPVLVMDLRAAVEGADARPVEELLLARDACSMMAIPIVYESSDSERSVAVIVMFSSDPGTFTDADRSAAQHLVPSLTLAIRMVALGIEHAQREFHTRIISQVTAEAIRDVPDAGSLYHRVAGLIHSAFAYYDVAIFEVEWGTQELILAAHRGDYRPYLDLDYHQSVHVGILGYACRSGRPYLASDVLIDPHYYNAFPSANAIRSELAIPIKQNDLVLAVLEVQSQEPGAFDRYDVESLEVLCQLLSRIREAAEDYAEMNRVKNFNSQILDAVPSSVVVLDETFHVVYANAQFCALRETDLISILFQPADAVFPAHVMEAGGLRELLESLVGVQGCGFLSEVKLHEHVVSRIVDIRVCMTWDDPPRYVLILDNVTARANQVKQLKMLQSLGQELQRTLDLQSLLRAILTCVTAGPGFALNRARIFLRDEKDMVLEERLDIGTSDPEEAHRIWGSLAERPLEDYLRHAQEDGTVSQDAVRFTGRNLRIPVSKEELDQLLRESRPFVLIRGEEHPMELVRYLRNLSDADEALIIPLCSRNAVLGIILADNLITREAISDRTLDTLGTFAVQAALAISNARAYRQLEQAFTDLSIARDKLSQSEKLAIIGQMGANVAHEIRNPLVSIGGWARRIAKTTAEDATRERIGIIVHEVARLEAILTEVMDFAAPFSFSFQTVHLEPLVRRVVSLLENADDHEGTAAIRMSVEAADGVPAVRCDPRRIEQVLINLAKNAMEAMGGSGKLVFGVSADDAYVSLAVSDTGSGIAPEALEKLFEPFFTTKRHGTGLGLMITRRIIEHHGGQLEAESESGQGTTFTVRLPRFDVVLEPNE